MTRRRTPLLLAGVVAASVLTTAQAQAETPAVTGVDGTVTLITGDQVDVRGGRAHVRPGQGRKDITFRQLRDERGHLHVLPSDAVADVRGGRLDGRLFDVTGLIRAGYDDRSSAVTPLIVTGGLTAGEPLTSIGGHALEVAKDSAFWSGARAAGVDRVWLDGPVTATLDRSVPQIGAPEAWQGGHTGSGTTVAVLDTGVDATHPDLAGAVVEAKNFSGSDTTDDNFGHGTHVAATITGAGRYQGVAPDTKLLSGKVLDDSGGGRESDIIAGMEWAAAAGADVVNMSLGSPWPTDGTDVMSLALNKITADTGALFVVSAGNSGPGDESIGSPAAADAALTVGAVDRADGLAEFSSRGPRWEDGAIKPDITAPGVGIVAAKARNAKIGDPVGDAHIALSGTSMAAPHVASAAAILAAQHPDWTAPRLKSALMASARPNPALTIFEQGAGRVDVARAVRQTAHAEPPSLSLGTARWPHHDDPPIERKLAYRNDGTTPLTLSLAAEVKDATGVASSVITVSPASVAVPAGGQAEVTVTATTSADSPDGRHSGAIVATGGDVSLRTPVTVVKEVESYDVTLSFVDHEGKPTPEYWYRFVDVEHRQAYVDHDPSGTIVARLPKGTYYFDGWVDTIPLLKNTNFTEPAIVVSGDMALKFDARDGVTPSFAVDRPTAKAGYSTIFFERKTAWGDTGYGFIGGSPDRLLFTPSKTSAPGRATFTASATLAEPDGAGAFVGSPYQYHVSWTHDGAVPASLARRFADRDLARVQAVVHASAAGQAGYLNQVVGGPLPLRVTEYYSPGVEWRGSFMQLSAPNAFPPETSQGAGGRTFTAGRQVTERWNAAVFGPAFPVMPRVHQWAGRSGDKIDISVPMFTDQDPTHYGFSRVDKAQTTIHRNGVLVGDLPYPGSVSAVVAGGRAQYVVHTQAHRSGVSELSTSVTADWTFTSDTVAGDPVALPLPAVRFAPALDDRNRARAGRPFAFPVYVQRNGGGPVGDVRTSVQVSYDDGASWRPVPLVKFGERWLAAVSHPADAKFVSLKASARDGAGNAVDQTIIRAYALG
ncbi:S8 family serine peptidase [Saccharothrix sp.]|uniref:S8 family serine peptidase n=1 Tax=Saccharothrix sp. TaxID=1873460 RepID=UPI002811693A|nr:S8 family serine peptidase [Saccharothrix sp.]